MAALALIRDSKSEMRQGTNMISHFQESRHSSNEVVSNEKAKRKQLLGHS